MSRLPAGDLLQAIEVGMELEFYSSFPVPCIKEIEQIQNGCGETTIIQTPDEVISFSWYDCLVARKQGSLEVILKEGKFVKNVTLDEPLTIGLEPVAKICVRLD